MAIPLHIDTVTTYLNGQLLPVLAALVPELDVAIARKGRHVAWPVHGGGVGFRLVKDVERVSCKLLRPLQAKADRVRLF